MTAAAKERAAPAFAKGDRALLATKIPPIELGEEVRIVDVQRKYGVYVYRGRCRKMVLTCYEFDLSRAS